MPFVEMGGSHCGPISRSLKATAKSSPMPGRSFKLPDLPTLTKDQVIALLSRVESGEFVLSDSVIVFAYKIPPRESLKPQPATASPAPPTSAVRHPRNGLERLGNVAKDNIRKLQHFHLAACAYDSGARGLRDVVSAFKKRKNSLPVKLNTHSGTLSAWFYDLGCEVFASYFGRDCFPLLYQPEGDGMEYMLTPEAQQALPITRDYLALINCLPVWPEEDA
jgi:hypothetical protein